MDADELPLSVDWNIQWGGPFEESDDAVRLSTTAPDALGMRRSRSVGRPLLKASSKSPRDRDGSDGQLHELDFSEVKDALRAAQQALHDGLAHAERPTREGVSGTYLIVKEEPFSPVTIRAGCTSFQGDIWRPDVASRSPKDVNVIGVFKPMDEEAGSFDNPNGLDNSEKLHGLLSRSASGFFHQACAYKEAAAYILDWEHFCGVPQTAMALCEIGNQSKAGAFQTYIQNIGDADDFGPGVFEVETVQRIAAFDIRTLNHDRHGGNLLAVAAGSISLCNGTQKYSLIPIDHGYILPDTIQAASWPVWMDWPQAKQPITPAVQKYIEGLNIEKDLARLRLALNGNLPLGSLRTLALATLFLQLGAQEGLSLHAIGLRMFARDTAEPSPLELCIANFDERRTSLTDDKDHDMVFDLVIDEATNTTDSCSPTCQTSGEDTVVTELLESDMLHAMMRSILRGVCH